MVKYKIRKFSRSRLFTIDVFGIGKQKHHVVGLIELDVSKSREKIKDYQEENKTRISFTAWLISAISVTLKNHENLASYRQGKDKLMIFEDINISIIVEKEMNGEKVPVPLVIEKAQERSIEFITARLSKAKSEKFTDKDLLLHKKTNQWERMYYYLPGFLRRYIWKYLLKHPKLAFKKMGNVAFTSIGMMGKVNGWFIPASVHPICFGISSILEKPVVNNGKIEIGEILNMTILLDYDVIDGAPMARFVNDLCRNIENGINL